MRLTQHPSLLDVVVHHPRLAAALAAILGAVLWEHDLNVQPVCRKVMRIRIVWCDYISGNAAVFCVLLHC